ncbi:MAG: hypothetical protein ACR2KC_02680 [Acidimicrobiales bacterium]
MTPAEGAGARRATVLAMKKLLLLSALIGISLFAARKLRSS